MSLLKRLHRWLGLGSGALLLLVAGSGVWLQFVPNRMDQIASGRMVDDQPGKPIRRPRSCSRSTWTAAAMPRGCR